MCYEHFKNQNVIKIKLILIYGKKNWVTLIKTSAWLEKIKHKIIYALKM